MHRQLAERTADRDGLANKQATRSNTAGWLPCATLLGDLISSCPAVWNLHVQQSPSYQPARHTQLTAKQTGLGWRRSELAS